MGPSSLPGLGRAGCCKHSVRPLVATSQLGYYALILWRGYNKQQGRDMLAVQCKGARVMLGLGVRDLAKAAGVSSNTVSRLERGEELGPRTIKAIREALEAAGVEFIGENESSAGGGPGVRLSKPKQKKSR